MAKRNLSSGRQLKPQYVRGQKEPLICIVFDDGNGSDYTIAFPEMAARGMKGTSYVITGSVGAGTRITWSNIGGMLQNGWAVECHSHTHPDLTTLSEAEIHTEMQNVNTAFQAKGLRTPRHHAYPWNANDATVRGVVTQYRDTMRTAGNDGLNDWNTIDYEQVMGQPFYLETNSDLDVIKVIIDSAITNNKILVLYSHEIHPTVFPSYGCLQPLFEDMLDYIVSKNVKVVTIPQMYKLLEY